MVVTIGTPIATTVRRAHAVVTFARSATAGRPRPRHARLLAMRRRTTAAIGVLAAFGTLGAACGNAADRQSSADAVFGAADTTCTSVELTNDDGDDALLREAVACLMAEIEADRSVTVDIVVPTAEGDPIFHRFAFDGAATLLVVDSRADTYGDGMVRATRCAVVRWDGVSLPEGVDCVPVDHAGFRLR